MAPRSSTRGDTASTPRSATLGWSSSDTGMLVVVLIWGFNIVLLKSALDEIPAAAFAAARFIIGAFCFVVLFLLQRESLRPARGTGWRLIWLGVVGNSVYQILFMYALAYTSAASVALILAATPVTTTLIGVLLGTERVTRRLIAGVAMAFAGIVLVIGLSGVHLTPQALVGDLLMVGAMLTWAAYTVWMRPLLAVSSSLKVTTLTTLTGLPGLVLFAAPQLAAVDWRGLSTPAWFSLLYSSILALCVAYLLWNTSVRQAGSTRTAIYTCVTPVIAAFVAWPVLGEALVPEQAAGAALVFTGVLLTRR